MYTNLGIPGTLGIKAGVPEFPIDRVASQVASDSAARTNGRYAILNPGAAWPNKRWMPARFGAIAAELRSRHSLTSVVAWGPGEEALAREVVEQSSGAALLSPRTTIADLVALARGAS